MDLRFYRNEYSSGEAQPLIYNDVNQVIYQMTRGAFTWIVDTHCELDNRPLGPYMATIDIDTSTAEHAEMLERVHDYYEFLTTEVKITPILVYSGNISFHFRIPLGDFSLDDRVGIFLPKLTTWTTYFRRHRDEIKLIFIRNAIDILTVAYNEWTNLPPVAILSIPKYSQRSKFKFFFDNRTGLHQGARVPGSFHHKSQRIARIFQYSNLPKTEAELNAKSQLEYLTEHQHAIFCPEIPEAETEMNLARLMDYTNSYYSDNFHRLIYQERLYHV